MAERRPHPPGDVPPSSDRNLAWPFRFPPAAFLSRSFLVFCHVEFPLSSRRCPSKLAGIYQTWERARRRPVPKNCRASVFSYPREPWRFAGIEHFGLNDDGSPKSLSRETRDIGFKEAIEAARDDAEAHSVPIVHATDRTAHDIGRN